MLKDYHIYGESTKTAQGESTTTWHGQTFTVFSSYTVTSIQLKLYTSDADVTGPITVGIYAVDEANKPTGEALSTGNINASTVTNHSSPGAWYTFTLSSGVALTALTRYALVINTELVDHFLYIRRSGSTNYAYGAQFVSSNSGSSWNIADSAYDIIFKINDSENFSSQIIYVGGLTNADKNLWKIVDDGTTLSIDTSIDTGDTVYSITKLGSQIFVATGHYVKCYNATDLSLDTTWATNGVYTVGAQVNVVKVDSNGYLAVGVSPKPVHLLNSNGSLVWKVEDFGVGITHLKSLDFTVDGDVIGICTDSRGDSKSYCFKLAREDGSKTILWDTKDTSYEQGLYIIADNVDKDISYFGYDGGQSGIIQLDIDSLQWQCKTGTTNNINAMVLNPDLNFLTVAVGDYLGLKDKTTGTEISEADYDDFQTITPGHGLIVDLSKNDNNEIYYVTGEFVGVTNLVGEPLRDLDFLGDNLFYAVEWGGVPAFYTSGTFDITTTASVDASLGKWRRILTEYMPDYEGNIKNFTVQDLTATRLVGSDGDKKLTSITDLTTWIAGTANEINITDDGDGTITIGIVDPLIVGKGGTGLTTLTDHSILLGSGTGAVTPLGVATNGQLPIGSTGADPVLAELTGTANQVTVTSGAGSITLSLPQDIHTAATPTLAGLILTGFSGLVHTTDGILSAGSLYDIDYKVLVIKD